MMNARGTDVSSNQHPPARLDWNAAKAVGFEFVLVKATQGATYRNPYFDQDVADARAAGLTVGAYHWVSPSSTAAAQIANFLAVTAGHIGPNDLPCGLDFEQSGATHAALDAIRAGINAAGLRTMTYTYPDFWTHNGSPTCTACAADPLWWASPTKTMLPPPRPWTSVAIWQYAGTSEPIPGVGAKEDANLALVPLSILTGQIPAPAPTPNPVSEDDMKDCYLRQDSKGHVYWINLATNMKQYLETEEQVGQWTYLMGAAGYAGNAVITGAPDNLLANMQNITPGGLQA